LKTKITQISLAFKISITCFNLSFSQELQDGQIRWSSDKKLSIDNFKLKTDDENNTFVSSQFLISYSAKGLDFLKRNLNKNIQNLFIENASWINTNKVDNIDEQIDFQQIQFDLAEIQARKFRQRLFLDKWTIAKGFTILDKISNEIMAEFSVIRLELLKETDNGRNKEVVKNWKEKITLQLQELDDFRYENKKKIKRKK